MRAQVMRVTLGRLFGLCLIAFLCSVTPTNASSDTRLVDAAKNRDAAGVAALVRQGIDVNSTQPDGATALLWAAQWDDLAMAEVLIHAGAKVDAANDFGVTPLSMACLNASAGMVDKLLSAGANPNGALPTGETAVMTAARTGNVNVVKALLARGADVNARETYRGQTALMWAIAQGHLDMARLLIEKGADTRATTNGGFRPIMFAAREGNIDAVKLLLAHGADVNDSVPNLEPPPSNRDIRSTQPNDARLSDGLSVLHIATLRGHVDLALFLLDHGANPNADGPGYTALHWAAWKSETYMTHDYPLARGEWEAVGGIPSRDGKLTLIAALLAKGANVNAHAKILPRFGHSIYGGILRGGGVGGGSLRGATPFFLAASVGDTEVMKLLVGAGADPMATTDDHTSPLMVAAGLAHFEDESKIPEAAHLAATKLCLELGNEITAKNSSGYTALHAAAYIGLNSVVQLLAEKGADLNARSNPGKGGARGAMGLTPMQAASDNTGMFEPHPETAALLLKLGAKE